MWTTIRQILVALALLLMLAQQWAILDQSQRFPSVLKDGAHDVYMKLLEVQKQLYELQSGQDGGPSTQVRSFHSFE